MNIDNVRSEIQASIDTKLSLLENTTLITQVSELATQCSDTLMAAVK